MSPCLSVFTYHKHIIAMIAVTTKERHPPAHRTVHQLRPVDIDIIASLGDSITAGTGAKARNIFEVNADTYGGAALAAAVVDRRLCTIVMESAYLFVEIAQWDIPVFHRPPR